MPPHFFLSLRIQEIRTDYAAMAFTIFDLGLKSCRGLPSCRLSGPLIRCSGEFCLAHSF
ncbi:hypothetical protein Hdeb2414_s0019g00541861 [Helianthus debilis subsp. tardiflorus]